MFFFWTGSDEYISHGSDPDMFFFQAGSGSGFILFSSIRFGSVQDQPRSATLFVTKKTPNFAGFAFPFCVFVNRIACWSSKTKNSKMFRYV